MNYNNLTLNELINYAQLDARTPLEMALVVAIQDEIEVEKNKASESVKTTLSNLRDELKASKRRIDDALYELDNLESELGLA